MCEKPTDLIHEDLQAMTGAVLHRDGEMVFLPISKCQPCLIRCRITSACGRWTPLSFADILPTMIDMLRSLFRTNDTPRAEVSLQSAVAALLIEAARADDVYDEDEHRAVLRLLQDMFSFTNVQAQALHDEADALQAQSPDSVRFTRVIKSALSEAERITFMEALWHVILVDHQRAPDEDALMRHLAPLVAVSDHDSAAARQRVIVQMGDGSV